MSVWVLEFEGFDPAREGRREALCTLGNGYFATRGAAAEAQDDDVHYPGTYIAGVYNRLETTVAGRTIEDESIVNAPNWLSTTFRVDDGCWLEAASLVSSRQELDLRRGILTRFLSVRDDAGRITHVTQRRLVSMDEPHLAALETTIASENWSGRLRIRSLLDGSVTNRGVARYRALAGNHLTSLETAHVNEETVALVAQTRSSRILIAEAARTRLHRDGEGVTVERTELEDATSVGHELSVDLDEGERVTVEKIVAVQTSRDAAISEPGRAVRRAVARAAEFDALVDKHALAWHQLWRRFGVSLEEGNDRTARILNLHIFHLLQTLSPHTAAQDVGVPARGLHGEAYRGHIFWDELFVFPILNLRLPGSPGLCSAIGTAGWPRRAQPRARPDLPGRCSPGRAQVTDGRKRSGSTSTPARAAGIPTIPHCRGTSTPVSPTTCGSTTRPRGTSASWPASGQS